jgi:cation diffusion facilitator CzcD-associated flavoprotein CzcO
MPNQQLDAIIAGAGIAGMYQLYRLRELGLKVRAYETGDGVGGAWYWNRYPGARFDSESCSYTYAFSDEILKEWNWSEQFSEQAENERYYNFVADKLDLRKDIQFNSKVTAARFLQDENQWEVEIEGGEKARARYMMTAHLPKTSPGFGIWLRNFHDIMTGEKANAIITDLIARKIRKRVKDPAVADILIPKEHGFGMKRVSMETNYYEAYNPDNVELVDLRKTPIERVNATDIKTSDKQYDPDFILYATGFDAVTGGYKRIETTHEAEDAWTDHVYDTVKDSPLTKADSWFMGANTPGKKRTFLLYGGGGPPYRAKCDEVAAKGYEGFKMQYPGPGPAEFQRCRRGSSRQVVVPTAFQAAHRPALLRG